MTYVHITWLADRLEAAGLDVIRHTGWGTRGRPSSTGDFNPRAVLMHHTAAHSSASNPHPSLSTVINGRSDLPGPLCHVLIGWNGGCHVIAAGRANHAGEARAVATIPAGDGNALYVGIEMDYHPDDGISDAQRLAGTTAAGAIVTRLGHSEGYVRGHKETCIPVGRKIDPSGMGSWTMDTFRAYTKKRIIEHGWWDY